MDYQCRNAESLPEAVCPHAQSPAASVQRRSIEYPLTGCLSFRIQSDLFRFLRRFNASRCEVTERQRSVCDQSATPVFTERPMNDAL